MRAVIQRVSSAKVQVDGQIVGEINQGLLILLGVEQDDEEVDLKYIADKSAGLRVFEDQEGKMNLSVQDVNGELLVVSQFTLLGDARKGKRPSFIKAADADKGKQFYLRLVDYLKAKGLKVSTGQFQAMMDVSLTNQGPVTILLDSKKAF